VGIVESVGAEVRDVSVGQRVAALSIVGAWAEYAVVPAAWVVPVPPKIESTTAVCLVLDYITAYQMLTRSASVQRGDTILIQGAGGGVGTALLQLARHLGVRALATDRERKRAHIESAGGILIDFEHEDVVDRARALTEGRGVDYAFDGIGDTASASLRALRSGGQMVWYGFGVLRAKLAGVLALGLLGNFCPGSKHTSIYSIQWLARRHPDWYREDLSTLLELLSEREIAPSIAAVLKLEEVPSALASLAGHGPPGKQVIAIAPGGLTSVIPEKATAGSVGLRA
jgi:NADPH2:quinone reductase